MFHVKNFRFLLNLTTQVNLSKLLTLKTQSQLLNGSRFLSINYKTPTNRAKTFKPTTIAVTNANKHLEIELHDQNDKDLGKMSMERAKELADNSELKLVIVDESCSPPVFKLMTGHELYKAQIKTRNEHKGEHKEGNKKEKEIDINLGISDHDLGIKIKMVENFHEKGHPVKIKVLSKILNKKDKNIPKLQDEFIEKLKKMIQFSKIKVDKFSDNQILLHIDAKTNQ